MAAASSGLAASFTPPALPRPPAWIWALTTALPPNPWATRAASSGVVATPPLGTATPKREKTCLAWNSWIFIAIKARHYRNAREDVSTKPPPLKDRKPLRLAPWFVRELAAAAQRASGSIGARSLRDCPFDGRDADLTLESFSATTRTR